MTWRYLLDTNILSEPLKTRPNEGIMHRLERHRKEVVTTAMVWNELLYGCYRLPPSARRRTLERYLHQALAPSIPILPYDEQAAEWHAAERARLEMAGRIPPFVDGQIASVAKIRGLILVTRNVSDYGDFQGLHVEDWTL
jgi:tRNA(fMet)-specific endonuclease VapC